MCSTDCPLKIIWWKVLTIRWNQIDNFLIRQYDAGIFYNIMQICSLSLILSFIKKKLLIARIRFPLLRVNLKRIIVKEGIYMHIRFFESLLSYAKSIRILKLFKENANDVSSAETNDLLCEIEMMIGIIEETFA